MLYLKNIRKDENRIYADYYPEDEKICGHVSVSLTDLDDYKYKPHDGVVRPYDSYVFHALNALKKIIEGKMKIEDVIQIMWY